MKFCNNQAEHTCNLDSWNPKKKWKMRITYTCNDPSTVAPISSTTTTNTIITTSIMHTTIVRTTATTTTTDLSTPRTETTDFSSLTTTQSLSITPKQSTDSGRKVRNKEDTSDGFPIGAAIAIPVGIVVIILVIVGLVCVFRRRSHGIEKGKHTNENTLSMQDMMDINNDNALHSSNRDDIKEAHEHEYVDTTSHKDINITTYRQEYVNNDQCINTTDDDEYNTLNKHPAPLQLDPNYDHLPKDSHTTVDETYSHLTEGQTAVPDEIYSHLKDSDSNAPHNVTCNQNNSSNVYNHINTLSVEDNVYNQSLTHFNKGPSSNFNQTRAEDDYDHTDWNQAKSTKPIARSQGAIKTSDTDTLPDDEYAVVNKRSDNVESNDGHNYFVLEKHTY